MYKTFVLIDKSCKKTKIGTTENIKKKLSEFNKVTSASKLGNPQWYLIHSEDFNSIDEAKAREKYLKSNSGKKKIRSLVTERSGIV